VHDCSVCRAPGAQINPARRRHWCYVQCEQCGDFEIHMSDISTCETDLAT